MCGPDRVDETAWEKSHTTAEKSKVASEELPPLSPNVEQDFHCLQKVWLSHDDL